MKNCVVSLLNTSAGRFVWYTDFPRLISEKLAQNNVAHLIGYKEHKEDSPFPERDQITIHDETDATSIARLKEILEPRLRNYDRVVLHSHSYPFDTTKFRRLANAHSNWTWWATMHTTPRTNQIDILKKPMRSLMQMIRVGYPDRIFGCSQASYLALRHMYGKRAVDVAVNGRLTNEHLKYKEKRSKPRRAIFVGRIVALKGIWIALEAAKMLIQDTPDFRLTVVGDGPDLAAAKEWVEKETLAETIRFVGHQFDVEPFYREADFLWLPTIPERVHEGLCLVALEALGFGLPAIYTDSGGLPEAEVDGKTGFLLNPPTAENLAEKTRRLIFDEDSYQQMRREIFAFREDWSMEGMVDRYVNFYLKHFAGIQ
jgi:glycosyltransferase involved in cell wall biosynthesis